MGKLILENIENRLKVISDDLTLIYKLNLRFLEQNGKMLELLEFIVKEIKEENGKDL